MRHWLMALGVLSVTACAGHTSMPRPSTRPARVHARSPFSLELPAGCAPGESGGVDSDVGSWRCRSLYLSYEWGAASVVGTDVTLRAGEQAVASWEEAIGGAQVRLLRFRYGRDAHGFTAVWPDLGRMRWRPLTFPAVLRVRVESVYGDTDATMLATLRSVQFDSTASVRQ
jgi:hypothetical protein